MTRFSRGGVMGVASIALLAGLPMAAQADGFWQTRSSFSLGQYTFDADGETLSDGSQLGGADEDGDIIAVDLGGTLGLKMDSGSTVVLDLELEAMTVDSDNNGFDFERVDIKASVGYVLDLGMNVTPFVGYRNAFQGDGYFDDSFYTESGYLLGVGVSGIELGTTRLGLSFAYNDTTLDAGSIDTDATGFSLKAGIRLADSPLGFSLKYQTFEADFTEKNDGTFFGGFDEGYLLASATWYFAQGKL